MKILPRNSYRLVAGLRDRMHALVIVLFVVLFVGAGCATKKPVSVVYINRPLELSKAARLAMELAKAEVLKWDIGAKVTDYRVQRHSNGYTVSLLISTSFDNAGMPLYDKSPIRNVEINQAGEVVGYHISH